MSGAKRATYPQLGESLEVASKTLIQKHGVSECFTEWQKIALVAYNKGLTD